MKSLASFFVPAVFISAGVDENSRPTARHASLAIGAAGYPRGRRQIGFIDASEISAAYSTRLAS
jgi:hypothetical protein